MKESSNVADKDLQQSPLDKETIVVAKKESMQKSFDQTFPCRVKCEPVEEVPLAEMTQEEQPMEAVDEAEIGTADEKMDDERLEAQPSAQSDWECETIPGIKAMFTVNINESVVSARLRVCSGCAGRRRMVHSAGGLSHHRAHSPENHRHWTPSRTHGSLVFLGLLFECVCILVNVPCVLQCFAILSERPILGLFRCGWNKVVLIKAYLFRK